MTLRQKTLLIIGLIFAALVLLLSILTRTLLLNSYGELQAQETRANVQRALNSLNLEIERFASSTNDYAVWDDSLNFVQDLNAEYVELNLSPATFTAFQFDFAIFTDAAGNIVYSKGINFVDDSERPVPQELLDFIATYTLLYQYTDINEHVEGFALLPIGGAIVASAPIRASDNSGPVGGALIWIRMLDERQLAALSEITQLSIDLQIPDNASLADDFRSAFADLLLNTPTLVRPLDNDRIAGYTLLNDLYGNPALIMRVDTSRSIYQQGEQSTWFFLIVMVILGAAAVMAALMLVERLVLSRLKTLSADVRKINETDLSGRVSVTGNDELAVLETDINKMLGNLEAAQTELRTSRDAAEQANRAKSTFLANMSHELRTPLNAIMGFLSIMMINGKLEPKDAYRAQRAYANSERLLNTINDILDISRIEAGRLQIVTSPLNVRDLMESIRVQMAMLAEEKNLPFTIQISDNVPANIETDSDALGKIITNLVSNGIKFTAKGSVNLDLNAADNQLIIKVTDTGIGIAPHMYDLIFETFRQVDDSSTRPFGGVGLGLAIVQNLCKAMHGSVRVESSMGQGSTFTVVLPFAQVSQEVA